MIKPINSYDLEKATGRVSCGSKGTCFLISSELALTAAHVVKANKKEKTPITLEFLNITDVPIERTASLLEYDFGQFDIAILKLDSPVDLEKYVPLSSRELASGEDYLMYGYPNEAYTEGKKEKGTVSRMNPFHTKWDIDLNLKTSFTAAGLSGAALVVNGYAAGIVLSQLDDNLHAISIKKIESLIEKNQIPFEKSRGEEDIPDNLKEEVEETADSQNTPVTNELDETLREINGGYALLTGTPGSGKTTLAANYSPNSTELEVAGRYFVKIPNDAKAIAIRASKQRLLSWFESVCYKILSGKLPEKREGDFNQKNEEVNRLLGDLGQYYKNREKIGILILDGLDDVNNDVKNNISDFLSILPTKLPDNLCVLFSCTSKAILPNKFKSQISAEREIKVTPLEKDKVENFIRKSIDKASLELTVTQIAQFGKKSEGHPLYLRYLVNYLIAHPPEATKGVKDFDKWIENIPVIDGNIKIYYKSVWNTIKDKSEEARILGTISRLRQEVPIEAIIEMLPEESREIWDSTYLKVNHLLGEREDNRLVSIYHSSFGEFINELTATSSTIIHNRIAQYCLNNQDTFYGLSNIIYHLYNGDNANKSNAVVHCNQEWTNNCALNSISPDFILTDIREALRLCFKFKKSVDVIRVLLLLQRMRFRYDEIFRENTFELAEALIAMGKTKEAVRYIIRDETLLVAIKDGGYFFQRMIEKKDYESAKEVFSVLDNTINRLIQENQIDHNMIFDLMYVISLETAFNLKKAMEKFIHFKGVISKQIKEWGNEEEVIFNFRDVTSSFQHAYMVWTLEKAVLPSEMEKIGFKPDKYAAGFYSLILGELKMLKMATHSSKEIPSHKELIKEIENLIDRFGYYHPHREFLIEALLQKSERVDIVEELIKEVIPSATEFSLRDKNGVNLNRIGVLQEFRNQIYLGYINDKSTLIKVPNKINPYNWEDFLTASIQEIGFLIGRGYRLRAEKKNKELKGIISAFEVYISKLDFTLFSRTQWRNERAYALPEEMFPHLYRNIILFFTQFYPSGLSDFVTKIIDNSDDQLGLYTEGYRNSIFEITSSLAYFPEHKKETFRLLTRLEEHIYKGVQNRWERAPELMKLSELYALIGADEKAERAFGIMLDSSMGISWYKEAQLGLVTSAIESLYDKDSEPLNLDTFAGHLDFASGEMTFQRYVRMEKENFVHSLCKIGHLDKAILYFKQVAYASPKSVKERAESSIIDTPFTGEGYELGTREIEEESAILNLLKILDNEINIYFKWVLGELFVSDDIHYLQDFADLLAKIISELHASNSSQVSFLLDRLVKIIKTKIEKPFRHKFISRVYRILPLEVSKKLHTLLVVEKIIEEEENDKLEVDTTEPVEHTSKKEDILDNSPW